MNVSVIIPAYSAERVGDLRETIESIQAQSYKPLEIIIAIDYSRQLWDKLARILTGRIRVVLNVPPMGGAEARNVGIRNSSGDIVAFIDDDAVAEKTWLECLLKHYSKSDVMAVGGKTISTWENGRPYWFPEELDWIAGGIWKGHPESLCEVRNLIGPNMSFRREICEKIGYMRSELGAHGKKSRAGDETEFYIRMKSLIPEGKIIYEPRAIVHHKVLPHKTNLRYLILRSYSDGYYKGKASGIWKYLSRNSFSVETKYLRFLLYKSIPNRLRHPSRDSITQVGTILASIVAFGVGYLRGKI